MKTQLKALIAVGLLALATNQGFAQSYIHIYDLRDGRIDVNHSSDCIDLPGGGGGYEYGSGSLRIPGATYGTGSGVAFLTGTGPSSYRGVTDVLALRWNGTDLGGSIWGYGAADFTAQVDAAYGFASQKAGSGLTVIEQVGTGVGLLDMPAGITVAMDPHANPVPEPSTMAAGLGALLIAGASLRSRYARA